MYALIGGDKNAAVSMMFSKQESLFSGYLVTRSRQATNSKAKAEERRKFGRATPSDFLQRLHNVQVWISGKRKQRKSMRSKDKIRTVNRSDQNLLAKLQSGHHVELREYMKLINPDLDGTCPHCRFRVLDKLTTSKH